MRVFMVTAMLLGLALVGGAALYMGGAFAPGAATGREPDDVPPGKERATFGAGCFWCTEAVFQQLKGVDAVVSGYTGGTLKDPTYRDICTGRTGHAEAIRITYDPAVISYAELLSVFWQTHDPTTRD